MKIVIDTNVVISGTFFGGHPRKVLEAVVERTVQAAATDKIIEEYNEIVRLMIDRKQGTLKKNILDPFLFQLEIVDPVSNVEVCRDPDDNKFIECAVDSKAVYIVSGDKDLLDIKEYQGIEIMTAAEFCKKYLAD